MKEKLRTLFLSSWSPTEKGLLLTDVLLFGILIGWMTSPLKGGLSVLSHNTIDNSSDDHSANEYGGEDEPEGEEDV